ncbi:Protein MAIN-LIKE 1 [Glycine max]|nr:Protein MAIN-LIKE 1 [Glycine max]
MVRTRGLGRALASVRGRGMGQDEHHADVSQRRRPTAFARRQRVHVDVTEDVPQVTEDVPHMDEDIPERIADVDAADVEGITIDGAKGSPADHAEGFPGGPRDPSVLTSFGDHVAHSIWSGEERPELKLVSQGMKVDKFGRSAPEIEGLVAATGLSPLIGCSVVTNDPRLIFAFFERWHRETSTFHLLVGELMITLDDAAALLHLPITGVLHSFEPLLMDEAIFLLMELLEVFGDEAGVETVRAHGAYIRISWLREVYQSRCHVRWWIVAAHAYLLHLGAATLVHMYDQLNEACQTPTRQMTRYLTLSQCWIYEHFPSVHQCVTDDAYAETTPCASWWLTTKAHMRGVTGASYRARSAEMGPIVVFVRPERVVRQFGYIQMIPLSPVSASLSYEEIGDRWMHFLDHVVPAGEICVVPGQVSADYMDWFFQISHPFVTLTQAGDQPRHPPTPHDEEYVEPHIPEVLVAFDLPRHSVDACEGCEAIAERLERVLNLRMVTEGTELHEIMQDCLRIARGNTSDGSLRARHRRRIDH